MYIYVYIYIYIYNIIYRYRYNIGLYSMMQELHDCCLYEAFKA